MAKTIGVVGADSSREHLQRTVCAELDERSGRVVFVGNWKHSLQRRFLGWTSRPKRAEVERAR
jgi:hypothetical protein